MVVVASFVGAVFGIVSCAFCAGVAFGPSGEIGATGREVMVLVVVVLV